MNRHTNMHLTCRDQIDHNPILVQDPKDPCEEAVRNRLAVRVDGKDDDGVFDGDCCRTQVRFQSGGGEGGRDGRGGRRGDGVLCGTTFGGFVGSRTDSIREDDRSLSLRILDILDPDRDRRPNNLLHRERVNDLRAVVREFGGFFRSDGTQQTGGRDFARVGGEDSVDFFPDLKLRGTSTDGAEGSAEVRITATDLGEEGTGDDAEETCFVGFLISFSSFRENGKSRTHQ
jgi:hypothetical protein